MISWNDSRWQCILLFFSASNEYGNQLGLNKIHRLTSRNASTLRIGMGDFEGNTVFAHYSTFRFLDSTTSYTLIVGGYSGTAGDSLSGHTNSQFSTRDRENDRDSRNCAVTFSGAWWYYNCLDSNLNGLYRGGPHDSFADGIVWHAWKGYHYSLRFTEMKLRRLWGEKKL